MVSANYAADSGLRGKYCKSITAENAVTAESHNSSSPDYMYQNVKIKKTGLDELFITRTGEI